MLMTNQEFWMEVYIAAIREKQSTHMAAIMADNAVESVEKRFPAAEGKGQQNAG
jgi:hypothetical protein